MKKLNLVYKPDELQQPDLHGTATLQVESCCAAMTLKRIKSITPERNRELGEYMAQIVMNVGFP